jgi:RHS repeat-associated protein
VNSRSQTLATQQTLQHNHARYDGDGRRVAKVGSKLYWYGSGGDILAETDTSGNTTAEYIFFGGKRIAMLPASSTPIYYVEDMLGTSRVITTNTGTVCYDADFYPYGGERPYTNSRAQNYKFEGKERDSETGNDDFGARYYSNRFGRWLSADWSSVPAPVPYANPSNPQTLNLYSMVADDPESFADLDGHCPICVVVVIGVAALGYAAYESYQGTKHLQEAQAHGESARASVDQIIEMARNPNGPAATQIDLNNAQNTYVKETAAELTSATQAASDFVKASGDLTKAANVAISGSPASPQAPNSNPASTGTEKAIGAGISTGTGGVKALNKVTEPAAGTQAQQQSGQQQSPSAWQGFKSFFSRTPPPPRPQAPKPPCSASPAPSCPG